MTTELDTSASPDDFRGAGCLLIHGFTGSPRELHGLQQYLQSKGVVAIAPVLPGHDTSPADMFNFTWRDWYACVNAEYEKLRSSCDSVFVCGQSMGGALALYLAANVDLDGVITLAAPVHFPLWKRIVVKLMIPVRRYRNKKGGEDIKEESARGFLRSYDKFPYYAVDQLFRLARKTHSALPSITQPILILHSQMDHTISFRNAQIIYESVASREKEKIDLDSSYHILAEDVEKSRVWKAVAGFITRNLRRT